MKPITEKHLAVLRRHMVEIVDMHFELASDETGRAAPGARLRAALAAVPRHDFVPQQIAAVAYQDSPLPIGFDKTISQPFIGALMIDLLDLAPGSRVLEVGTGLGYQAAVMAAMGARVFTVEVVEEFAMAAEALLSASGYKAEVRVGDGSRGWAAHAPFDAILVTAAASVVPAALVGQLQPGGRMVIPLGGKDVQQLSVVTRAPDGRAGVETVMPVRFTRLELSN